MARSATARCGASSRTGSTLRALLATGGASHHGSDSMRRCFYLGGLAARPVRAALHRMDCRPRDHYPAPPCKANPSSSIAPISSWRVPSARPARKLCLGTRRATCAAAAACASTDRSCWIPQRGSPPAMRWRSIAPRPSCARARSRRARWCYVDADVVVVNKPAGIMSVPFEQGDKDTLIDLTRAALRRSQRGFDPELGIVHRIDIDTTGLLVFTRNLAAKTPPLGAVSCAHRAPSLPRDRARPRDRAHLRQHAHPRSGRWPARLARPLSRRPRQAARGRSARHHARASARAIESSASRPAWQVWSSACSRPAGSIRFAFTSARRTTRWSASACTSATFAAPRIEAPRPMLHAAELGFEHPRTGKRAALRARPARGLSDVCSRQLRGRAHAARRHTPAQPRSQPDGAPASADSRRAPPPPSQRAEAPACDVHAQPRLAGAPALVCGRQSGADGVGGRAALHMPLSTGRLYAIVLATATSNLLCALWLRQKPAVRECALAALMAFDFVLLTALLHAAGGPSNPFTVLYLVHIALAAIVLRPPTRGRSPRWPRLLRRAVRVARSTAPSMHMHHAGARTRPR